MNYCGKGASPWWVLVVEEETEKRLKKEEVRGESLSIFI